MLLFWLKFNLLFVELVLNDLEELESSLLISSFLFDDEYELFEDRVDDVDCDLDRLFTYCRIIGSFSLEFDEIELRLLCRLLSTLLIDL